MSTRTSQDIRNLRLAFRLTRKLGEKMLQDHKITWEVFSIFMLAFEEELRSSGEVL